MTRAQRVDFLASAAGMLAQSYGKVIVLPDGRGAIAWSDGTLGVLLWADQQVARINLFKGGRKVLQTSWHPGATRHEAISFKRGAWEQTLETAAQGMIEGLKREAAGGTLH